MQNKPDCLVLFSGGLDSLLAALLLRDQGLKVRCLHFTSPFFGAEAKIPRWQRLTGLEIEALDATDAFITMLANRPPHGTGKVLNPCLDCNIVLLRLARQRLLQTGAQFLATGEVRGQRPMSQRADAMNIVLREAGVKDILLRPLSALLLHPTPMEECGLVDRQRLLRISGRGRVEQLQLAHSMGLAEIPAPGGGCRLTERENARRYWPLLRRHWQNPVPIAQLADDFSFANLGRMLFKKNSHNWMCIGRNQKDNEKIGTLASPGDVILRLPFPGPLALARRGQAWPVEDLTEAAAILASFSPKAREAGATVRVGARIGGELREFPVMPDRHEAAWGLPEWEETREEIRADRKNAAMLPEMG